jgi:hypothetical protein
VIYHIAPSDVPAVWPSIESGLERAIAMSHNETSSEVVRELLESGKALLVVVTEGDRQVGFAVVEPYSTSRGPWLNIIFAYSESSAAVAAGYTHIVEIGRQLGVVGVKLFSARPGMSRLAKKLGMKRRFVEYVQEIQ